MNDGNNSRSRGRGSLSPILSHFQTAPKNTSSTRIFKASKSFGILLVGLITIWPTLGLAQISPNKVITADTGVQYEGLLFEVSELSETTSALNALGTKSNDIVVIDDGLRRVFLNPNHVVANIGDSNQANDIEFEIDQRDANWSEGGGTFVSVGPFDRYGHRDFTVGISNGSGTAVKKTYVQGITKITPRYCVLRNLVGNNTFAGKKQWTMHIATSTVPKDVLRNVLLSRIKDPDKPDEYFNIAYLFQQMGDFKQASEELRQIEINPKFNDMKERIRDARDRIGQSRARQILREIQLRKDSGQFELAVQLAKVTNKDRLAGAIKAEFADIEVQETLVQEELESRRKQFFELIEGIQNVTPEQTASIERFRLELESELNRFNSPRLDAYAQFSKDAAMPDQQKLAIAISGWMFGSNNTITSFADAHTLFEIRDLVREYLAAKTNLDRRAEIIELLNGFENGAAKYIDQIIQQMTPIDSPAEIENYTGAEPVRFSIEIPGLGEDKPQTYECLAHLPPQYNPYRKYPLILSLPGGIQTLEQNLEMWCGSHNEKLQIRQGQAMRHGYIVVTVDWRAPGQLNWGYSGREHRIVLDGLYHSLRKFSIDSDRVFISGHREGGDGAYDIGVSHPEHWAGVMGFSGKFGKYIDKYWDNKHVPLAFYIVQGQKDWPAIGRSKYAINKWMGRGYINPTVVWYTGRGNELFLEDLPEAFKWMRGQKRNWPDKSGFSFECSALRPWDTYYWFFEMHGIPAERTVYPDLFGLTKKFNKLAISGEIKRPNEFRLGPASMKIKNDATLWLSPQFVDFEERIVIEGRGKFKDYVIPSRKVVLDDYLRRADREHIYHAKIDCKNGQWSEVKE